MDEKCEKQKVYSGVFCATFFFAFRASVFTFLILRQGRHLRKNSKDFVVYFFVALIKHKIRMKCEKCIVSVSYFVVCFAKNTRKMRKVYSRPYGSSFHEVCRNWAEWWSWEGGWNYPWVKVHVSFSNVDWRTSIRFCCSKVYSFKRKFYGE